jgi:tetratricopeptide (TPR) repeat protein
VLDDSSAEVHSALGWIRFAYDWRWQDAEAHVRRAIALNPSYAPAHSTYSGLLIHYGRQKEAIAEMQIARFSFANSLSAMANALQGHFDEAIVQAKRGANPTDSPVTLGLLGEVFARAGQVKEAEQILDQLEAIAAKTYMCHHEIAALQAILGHKEER